jgi:hypothetical protein
MDPRSQAVKAARSRRDKELLLARLSVSVGSELAQRTGAAGEIPPVERTRVLLG